jgi:transcriptional regulator with GAF, ATPase, and Fis domain
MKVAIQVLSLTGGESMYDAAKIQNYRHAVNKISVPTDWMTQLSTVLETRQNDDQTIQKLLKLMVSMTSIDNISVAIPDSSNRFQAKHCSRQVENGVYSFAVQHSLYRAFDSGSVLVIREGSERPEAFNREALSPMDFSHRDHCLLVPLRLRQTTVAVLVLDLRNVIAGSLPLQELWFVCSQLAHTMATQIVPNFQTLYSRPYQRVDESELGQIQQTVEKCGGNKTMASKILGLTPRQLRYRLSKLS